MKGEIAKLLDVGEDELQEREWVDTFNNNNELNGFLCTRSDHRYGCLVITNVNEKYCKPQIIYCTPKLHYPFDKQGTYHWPDCKKIEFYEKLDGTNICSYWYGGDGHLPFLSYKTRLTPVLVDQKFGSFKSMWEEYLNENEWVSRVIQHNPYINLSFEMFGYRNPITIKYSQPLEVNLLFGIDMFSSAVIPPSKLNTKVNGVKIARYYHMVGDVNGFDLTRSYNQHREHMSTQNQEQLTIEGMVMYADVGELSWKMFKCKPEEIEKIHWTASGFIPERSLFTTALNTFESNDDPAIEDFLTLLKEEYEEHLLTKSFIKIQRIWKKAFEHIEFTKQVNDVYILAKQNGLDITKDKNETMRFMSKHFSRNIMGKVGTVILKQAGLIKEKRP